MNLNNYLKLLSNSRFQQIITIIFFILFFVIGLNIYKDYGLSNDEPFQRSVGYFWYIHLLENFSNNVLTPSSSIPIPVSITEIRIRS